MQKALWMIFGLVLGLAIGTAPALDIKLASEVHKVDESAQVEQAPTYPAPIPAGSLIDNPARLFPPDPVAYVSIGDMNAAGTAWAANKLAEFWTDRRLAVMKENNRFSLRGLYSDLPDTIVSRERVRTAEAVLSLAYDVLPLARKAAFALYIGSDGNLDLLCMFDVGSQRMPAFECLLRWESVFLAENQQAEYRHENHTTNFLDRWWFAGENKSNKAEMAAGYIENVLVITNSFSLAGRVQGLARNGASLMDTTLYRKLTSRGFDALGGYIRMGALLDGVKNIQGVQREATGWADILGRGPAGDALFYGLKIGKDAMTESVLLPTLGQDQSLLGLLQPQMRPCSQWQAVDVIPYIPTPQKYYGVALNPAAIAPIVHGDWRIATRDGSFLGTPQCVANIVSDRLANELTGEIGLALYAPVASSPDGEERWLLVLPCNSNPQNLLPDGSRVERSGVTIFYQEDQETNNGWESSPAWMALRSRQFKNITSDYVVVASEGALLRDVVDQAVAGSTFANDEDFSAAVASVGTNKSLIMYINTNQILVDEYSNISAIYRSLYPRSSGINNRPSLSFLRRFLTPSTGSMRPAGAEPYAELTIRTPVPLGPAMAAGAVLFCPRNLREDGRRNMDESQGNLANIWTELQLYASRYGRYPKTLQDLVQSFGENTDAGDLMKHRLKAPGNHTDEESYGYISGVMPTDESDLPLVYEARAWSEDFKDYYPADGRAPRESGDYVPFRQYARLDGQIVVMPETEFVEKIKPRIDDRE